MPDSDCICRNFGAVSTIRSGVGVVRRSPNYALTASFLKSLIMV